MLGFLRVTSDNSAPPRGRIESVSDSDDTNELVFARKFVWHLVSDSPGAGYFLAVATDGLSP